MNGGTSTSSSFFTGVGPIQTKSVITGTGTLRSMKMPHCNWDWVVFFERLGKKLARHIGDRSGVPHAFWTGHWMSWWISVKCMDSIHGRCRHMIPECPTWANLPSIYDQAACGVCFNSHVTPLEKGAELFFSIVFFSFGFFFWFRAWCDSHGVLQVCRMVSAKQTYDVP